MEMVAAQKDLQKWSYVWRLTFPPTVLEVALDHKRSEHENRVRPILVYCLLPARYALW
jgi:hypothetical protein